MIFANIRHNKKIKIYSVLILLLSISILNIHAAHGKTIPETFARQGPVSGKFPLRFEDNQGQADPRAKYMAYGKGYNLFLTPAEMLLSLYAVTNESRDSLNRSTRFNTIRIEFPGADSRANITGEEKLPGKSNYFLHGDSTKWIKDVNNFKKVRVEDLYPGIDLIYYGKQGRLEFDFLVSPGANTDLIRLFSRTHSLLNGLPLKKRGPGNIWRRNI